MATAQQGELWVSGNEMARILGIKPHAVARVAEANGIRRRVIKGVFTKFSRQDCERLAESCITGGDSAQQGRVA